MAYEVEDFVRKFSCMVYLCPARVVRVVPLDKLEDCNGALRQEILVLDVLGGNILEFFSRQLW